MHLSQCSTTTTSSIGKRAAAHAACPLPAAAAALQTPKRPVLLQPVHVAAPEQVATTPATADADQQRRPATTVIAAPAPPAASLQQLPQDIRNATAVLEAPNPAAPGGVTRVYVLGASHVSQVSCQQIKDLIRAVKPEVVMVELCKERVGLLVDGDNEDRRLETWHCRKVSIDGVPDDPLWPTADQLLQLLATRLGAAVHTKDIEADCSRLLATGLFGRARPAAIPAKRGEAPQFGAVIPEEDDEDDEEGQDKGQQRSSKAVVGTVSAGVYSGDVALQIVPPLGSLRFAVEPRKLPIISSMDVRLDSSLKQQGSAAAGAAAAVPSAEALQAIVSGLLEAAAANSKAKSAASADAAADADKKEEAEDDKEKEKEKKKDDGDADNSLLLYLKIRQQLAAQFADPDQVVVDFSGVESGRVEALVRARRAADPAFVSGLESSAVDGEGLGIDSFRPQRSSVQLSPGMLLPAEAAERLAAVRAARQAERVLGPPQGWSQQSSFRLWEQAEVAVDSSSQLPPNPVADTFAQLMTGLYAKLQSEAGDKAGISPGAAWRAAMEAATEVGSQQVVLGDRPSDVSQRHLAAAMTGASGGRLAAALGLLLSGIVAASTHILPDVEAAAAAVAGSTAAADAGIVGAAAAAALALVWPVLSPFVEVWRFSQLSGQEVEDVVFVKEPLQSNLDRPFYVWGEDAMLSWPGAEPALITERDAFMSRVLAAAATSSNSNAPAFVAEEDSDGQMIWRYVMPEGPTAPSAPQGAGDGAYQPLPGPSAVVAVVGSAHVRGMCKAWQDSLAAPGQVQQLLEV